MERKAIVVARGNSGVALNPDHASAATLRIANRPIVSHVLESLQTAGVDETYVVGTSSALTDIRLALQDEAPPHRQPVYLPSDRDDDLVAMISPAAERVGDAACVIHAAEGLLGQPLEPLAELVRPDHPDLVLLLHGGARRQEPWDQEALHILRISEITGFTSPSALAGACLLGPGALALACSTAHPTNPASVLTTLAERVAEIGGRVQAGRVSWRRYDGDPLDLLELNRMVLDQLPSGTQPTERDGNRFEGRVLIHPTAEVRDSVIAGPVIIGAGARVESAYIGPYTSIGRDACVEGTEICRSILLEEARIIHVRERIESSTIGRGACIRSEFALPKSTRLHIGEGAELVLA